MGQKRSRPAQQVTFHRDVHDGLKSVAAELDETFSRTVNRAGREFLERQGRLAKREAAPEEASAA